MMFPLESLPVINPANTGLSRVRSPGGQFCPPGTQPQPEFGGPVSLMASGCLRLPLSSASWLAPGLPLSPCPPGVATRKDSISDRSCRAQKTQTENYERGAYLKGRSLSPSAPSQNSRRRVEDRLAFQVPSPTPYRTPLVLARLVLSGHPQSAMVPYAAVPSIFQAGRM